MRCRGQNSINSAPLEDQILHSKFISKHEKKLQAMLPDTTSKSHLQVYRSVLSDFFTECCCFRLVLSSPGLQRSLQIIPKSNKSIFRLYALCSEFYMINPCSAKIRPFCSPHLCMWSCQFHVKQNSVVITYCIIFMYRL